MTIPEPDWKKFKQLRLIALERLAQRILDESIAICCNDSLTAHQRYGDLYELIQKQDHIMGRTFNDLRRSTAVLCLGLMRAYDLITEDEIAQFSQEVQVAVKLR